MFGKFFAAPAAGRHRNCARSKRLPAGNVPRRIANHVDLIGGKLAAMLFFGPRPGERPELVTIVMIVRERAEFEKMPDTVVTELQLRPTRDIASQKAEHDVFPCF